MLKYYQQLYVVLLFWVMSYCFNFLCFMQHNYINLLKTAFIKTLLNGHNTVLVTLTELIFLQYWLHLISLLIFMLDLQNLSRIRFIILAFYTKHFIAGGVSQFLSENSTITQVCTFFTGETITNHYHLSSGSRHSNIYLHPNFGETA